ncbi:conserved hypothetical protein [Ricinus communis]|uniref:F-box domain-containing protein n=1 Tax=Ricinus communis TaxID=3988 RepID=B9SIF9_RICCO|nr:conserved hypothetical protein [Ricinus communis]
MSIPVELLWEIFAKSPVKSLMRFKSICRLFHSIISDPEFVKVYFGPSRLLLVTYSYELESVTIEALSGNNNINHITETLDVPWNKNLPYDIGFFLHGSCNGLICLSVDDWLISDKIRSLDDLYNLEVTCTAVANLYLWNPTIGDFKALPTMSSVSSDHSIGFGHDKSTNDYKVVAIDDDRSMASGNRFKILNMEIFSLKKDSSATMLFIA